MYDNFDKVAKILIAKDLLPFMSNDIQLYKIEKILRPVIVTSENKGVNSMLKEFHTQNCHI